MDSFPNTASTVSPLSVSPLSERRKNSCVVWAKFEASSHWIPPPALSPLRRGGSGAICLDSVTENPVSGFEKLSQANRLWTESDPGCGRGPVISLWEVNRSVLTAYKSLSHFPVGLGWWQEPFGFFSQYWWCQENTPHIRRKSRAWSLAALFRRAGDNTECLKTVSVKGPREMSLGPRWVRPVMPLEREQGQSRLACLRASFFSRLPLLGGTPVIHGSAFLLSATLPGCLEIRGAAFRSPWTEFRGPQGEGEASPWPAVPLGSSSDPRLGA